MNDIYHLCILIVLLLIIGNGWVYFRVLRPLRRLASQAASLTEGDFAAFQFSCGGIHEIDELRRAMAGMVGHIRRNQQQTGVYQNALMNGQEAERARIARELHDETIQSLIAISQSVDLATRWLGQPQAADLLKGARSQAVEAVENLRRLIADLRPPALEELGLIPALQMMGASGAEIQVNVEGSQRRVEMTHELTLFRIAQEAVRNAERHGRAKKIAVHVAYLPDRTRLIINDDGIGFDLTQLDRLTAAEHFGLRGIQERITHLNGTVQIGSTPGKGTRIQVEIPQKSEPQPANTVRDPVCSALIQPQQAYSSMEYEGQRYYFCCPVCQGAFQQSPESYLSSKVRNGELLK